MKNRTRVRCREIRYDGLCCFENIMDSDDTEWTKGAYFVGETGILHYYATKSQGRYVFIADEFQIDTVSIGNAEEVLSNFDDKSVDAIITDPPFGIGKQYENEKESFSSPSEYGKWISQLVVDCRRILRPGGFFACWQSQVYFQHFWDWFGSDIHIYCAAKNFVQLRKKAKINSGYDPVIMFYTEGEPRRPKQPKRNLDFFVANTAAIVSNINRIERRHPYPRPLDQVLEIVSNFVVEGGTILDVFCGSGTIPVAALKTGRHFYGFDHSSEFVALSKQRIALTKAELDKYSDLS